LIFSVMSFILSLSFCALLLRNRQDFHFSFHLLLLQIIWCGLAKVLVRAISIVDFKERSYLFAIELMFDFGLLLFILLMALNRFFVISMRVNSFLYSNK
ncbi:hypothetical protein PFISCL1PPCAC_15166, partial [Pristionchus fissidentatus]